jgi:hypothetical protein
MAEQFTRHPDQPEVVAIAMTDGVFVKATTFASAGMVVPQHAHSYDHLSFIAAGAARVWADDVLLGDFHAPHAVEIKAYVHHRFDILAPGTTVLCIHNADRADGDLGARDLEIADGLEPALGT